MTDTEIFNRFRPINYKENINILYITKNVWENIYKDKKINLNDVKSIKVYNLKNKNKNKNKDLILSFIIYNDNE